MNKISVILLLSVLVLSGTPGLAQNTAPDNNAAAAQRMMRARYGATGGNMAMNPLMSKEKIEKFMQSLLEMGLLYKMLEQPTMVSTDNGVIVAYGNSLRKYDKDLNVVKEVDMDVNVDGMQELASKFAKKYADEMMDLMGDMTPASGVPSSASTMPSSNASTSAPTSTSAVDSAKSLEDRKEEEIKKEIEQMK